MQNCQIQFLKAKHGKHYNDLVIDGTWQGDGHDLYLAYLYEQKILCKQRVATTPPARAATAPRRTRQRGSATRSSASSGDGNSSDDSDGEPPRSLPLLDQAALAAILCIATKTLQNLYSSTPHLLPPAIAIPGARGPRWTPLAVQEWLQHRPQHTSKPLPVAPKRAVGRPRIALAGKGGAS